MDKRSKHDADAALERELARIARDMERMRACEYVPEDAPDGPTNMELQCGAEATTTIRVTDLVYSDAQHDVRVCAEHARTMLAHPEVGVSFTAEQL